MCGVASSGREEAAAARACRYAGAPAQTYTDPDVLALLVLKPSLKLQFTALREPLTYPEGNYIP
ncbi:hypothetical protein KDW_46760 [Dictyobacter vulcani]|uniref:Uncharacterized protein n=1 Tax=Dictyobacter vulcani TaxID=2607529 RepID=A0A5J4KMB3_9CHLR|nr:hypothetical protein KDW_46760 [Dictyobacter vulcani]